MIIEYVDFKSRALIKNDDGQILNHHFKTLPFRIQKIVLSPQKNADIIQQAKERVQKANFNIADSSGRKRSKREVELKSLCGFIVEQVCYILLQYFNHQGNVSIELDQSNTAINQVDLSIVKTWLDRNQQTQMRKLAVEIRSSFPFKDIGSSVANDFDILGPYINQVKKVEMEKDFYLRFLFQLDYPKEYHISYQNKSGKMSINYTQTTNHVLDQLYFDEELNLKRDLVLYFVGGATKEMMNDDSISYVGSMTSESFNQQEQGQYRKIKIRNALDSISILQMMLNVITNENTQGK